MMFCELAEAYLEDKREGRKPVRANTLEGYLSAVRTHLLPRWGQAEAESVTYEDVQSWIDTAFPDGRAAERAYKTLRQIIRWGISRRVVTMADPTIGVEVPKPSRREQVTLTDRQLNQMLYACRGETWEAVVWCQATLFTDTEC